MEERVQKEKHPYTRKLLDFKVWNKGLTKETSSSVKRGADTAKKTKKGRSYSSWSKGLTRATDSRVDAVAKLKEGKDCTETTRKKISTTLKGFGKGRELSKETRSKIGKGNKDKVRTPEMNLHNRLLHLGKTQSLETIQKKIKNIIGSKTSEDTKKKQSLSRIAYLENHRKEFKWFNTKPELAVKELLERLNIGYVHQKKVCNCLFDFYLPKHNLLIEVDGVYHHGKFKAKKTEYDALQLKIMKKDIYKNELALKEGYKLKRVWSDEIEDFEEWLQKNL